MKKTIFTSLLSLMVLFAFGQKDQTLFNGNGIGLTGIWGGSNTNLAAFDDDYNISSGGYFVFEFNKSLLLGWDGFESTAQFADIGNLKMDSNGLLIGYSPNSTRLIHPYFYLYGGSTKLILNEVEDRALVIKPSVGIEMNVLRWFRLGMDVGYRAVSGSDYAVASDKDLSGFYGGLRLKFGWSWGS